MKKGEITAFLSLIFVLMISFVTAILESASVQAEKNQARLDMDRAVYSVFGEYQKELLEEYGIFAVEGSYETGNFSEKQLIDRMHYYGASGIWPEVEGIQFLTDQNGQAFREGAVKYMEDLYGISIIQGLGALAEKWEQQEITGEQTKDESNQSLEELDDMLNQNQSSLPMENNPLPHIEQLKKSGLISLVFPKEKQVSQKQVRGEEQASSRALRTGRGTFPVRSDVDEITKKLLFHEYILKKFGNAVEEEKEKRSLAYEVEYLLEGKTSDQENLEAVLNKLLLIRMGLNFVYLQTDTAKQAEAGAMALALATAVALPMLESVVKQARDPTEFFHLPSLSFLQPLHCFHILSPGTFQVHKLIMLIQFSFSFSFFSFMHRISFFLCFLYVKKELSFHTRISADSIDKPLLRKCKQNQKRQYDQCTSCHDQGPFCSISTAFYKEFSQSL